MIPMPQEAQQLWFDAFGYQPGPSQRRAHNLLNAPNTDGDGAPVPRVVIMGGGEQAGKSTTAGFHVASRFMVDKLVWLVGDRYVDTEAEYHYIVEAASRAGVVRSVAGGQDGPWKLTYTNGHVVETLASADVRTIARKAPDGIVMCEPGRQSYEAFEYLWRRCVPRTGWMLVPGTFEGEQSSWYPDLAMAFKGPNSRHGAFVALPSWENHTLYPGGIRDPKLQAAFKVMRESNPTEGDEDIAERFGGQPRRPKGLVMSTFSHDRHVTHDAEFDPMLPVTLAVDPGYYPSAYAVLWLQVLGDTIRQFNEFYLHHLQTTEVATLVKNHPAFGNVTRLVIDVAGRQHGQGAKSAIETWTAELSQASRPIPVVSQYVHVDDSISRVRDKLKVNPITNQPYYLVHPRCQMTIWEFTKGYRRAVNSTGIVTSDTPIDADNHAMKALGYYIVDRFGNTDVDRRPLPKNTSGSRSVIAHTFRRRR